MRLAFYLLFFFSGAAGLGCQLAWSRMFAAGLGHEMPALLAALAAFMGGMALGAWGFDRATGRGEPNDFWYGGLELVVGAWTLATTALVPWANQAALSLIGLAPSVWRHWGVAFLLPAIVLLPATTAMGATLPALERLVSRWTPDQRCVGALYAANTLGAVAGTLIGPYLVIPALGFTASLRVFAAVNLTGGALALALAFAVRRRTPVARTAFLPAERAPKSKVASRGQGATPQDAAARRIGLTMFATGLFGIGFEVVGVRVLAQAFENTVFSYAAVLSVFLLGTALGAALFQRFGRRVTHAAGFAELVTALSAACLLGVIALAFAPALYDAGRRAFGDGQGGVLAAEGLVAATALALPTMLMGAVFSFLAQAARRADGGIGTALALNTLGAALAPALFGVALIPLVGSKWTLIAIALSYLGLAPRVRGRRWLYAPLLALAAGALAVNLRVVELPQGGRLREFREGVMAAVAVVEDATRNRALRVDNRFQMGGTAAAAAEYRHAHIPLLLHPAPRRALFLGLGTGITFAAAGFHPDLSAEGVELIPEILAAMPEFEPFNEATRLNPRLKMQVADARRFARAATNSYDVIVADLFHPARDGAGTLYTVEHFRALRARLAPGGLFCQWLPLHQLDEAMLRVITRSFLEVFPSASAYLLRFNVDAPVLGLVGRLDPPHYSPAWVEARLTDPTLASQLKQLSLADSIRLFGCLAAGTEALRQFADGAPLNTDDRPVVLFGAPRFIYQKNATPYARLQSLLRLDSDRAGSGGDAIRDPKSRPNGMDAAGLAATLGLKPGPATDQFTARLGAYITARDIYLRGLVDDAEGRSAQAIDRYVESARLSDDFTPGYAQCLTMASLLAKSRPAEARALLERLVQAQPARPVAREMLQRLFPR